MAKTQTRKFIKRIAPMILILAMAVAWLPTKSLAATPNTYSMTDLNNNIAAGTNVVLGTNFNNITSQLTISNSVSIDLNGYSMWIEIPDTAGRTSNGIKINPNKILTIKDSAYNGANSSGRLTVSNRASNNVSSGCGAAINVASGTLNIQAAYVSTLGGYWGAGIGGGQNENSGVINIENGYVLAIGGLNAAGIGGGAGGGCGIITIIGGIINATGSYGGAGIGCGNGGSGGAITISFTRQTDQIDATAGNSPSSGTQTAIGGGNNSSPPSLLITGLYDYWASTGYSFPGGSKTGSNSIIYYNNSWKFIRIMWPETPPPPQYYTVTFRDCNCGGNAVLDTNTVQSGSAAFAPSFPTNKPTNHRYSGWSPASFSYITSNLTVTAQCYTIIEHIVTFRDCSCGSNAVLRTQTIQDGSAASAPSFPTDKPDGHNYSGWSPASFSNITSALTVTAQCYISHYTVTFIGPDGEILDEQIIEHGFPAAAPTPPIVVGKTFKGWGADFSETTSDLTVTALYDDINFTVTFIGYGGEVLDAQTVVYGFPAKEPSPPNIEGKKFIGWNKDFAKITSDLTVTAQYGENIDDNDVKSIIISGTTTTIYIGIEWGELNFAFDSGERIWDPLTHTYTNGSRDASWLVNNEDQNGGVATEWYLEQGNNAITITNHSNVAIDVFFSYIMGTDGNSTAFNADAADPNAVKGGFYSSEDNAKAGARVLTNPAGSQMFDTLPGGKISLPTAEGRSLVNKDIIGRVYFAFSGTPDIKRITVLQDIKKVGTISVAVALNDDPILNTPGTDF